MNHVTFAECPLAGIIGRVYVDQFAAQLSDNIVEVSISSHTVTVVKADSSLVNEAFEEHTDVPLLHVGHTLLGAGEPYIRFDPGS